MSPFLQSESLATLGQALLNGVWQMGLLWLTYLLLTGNQKRFTAARRHDLALLLSALGCSWFLFTLMMPQVYMMNTGNPMQFPFIYPSVWLNPLLPAFTLIYLAVLVYLAIRYLAGFYHLHTARKTASQLSPEFLQSFTDRILPAMGIRKPVKIMLVNWTNTAQTVGVLKPLIFLPVALINRLSMEQVETILLHELHHIRRNDYLIHIGMMAFRTIFFFNPFAHFFFRTISRERELACDDCVLQWDYPVPVYAEALFALEKFRQRPDGFSLAVDGNNPRLLIHRIRRLTGSAGPGKNPFSAALSLSLVAALFIFIANSLSYFHYTDTDQAIQARLADLSSPVAAKNEVMNTLPKVQVVLKIQAVAVDRKCTRTIRATAIRKERSKLPQVPAVSVAAVVFPDNQEMQQQQLQYADRTELRNYSNEQAVNSAIPAVINLAGTPYVPTSSFSYSVTSDTVPEVLLQNKAKAALALSRIETAEAEAKINSEISSKKAEVLQLKLQIEKTSREQKKEIEPVIKKVHQEMLIKQKEIRQLQQQLVREIIFI